MASRANLAFLSGATTGHYRATILSGLTTGIAAGGTLFSARMAGAVGTPQSYYRALIQRIKIQAIVVTPFTAAQEFSVTGFAARSWSAPDSGGTTVVFANQSNMLNSIGDNLPVMSMFVANAGAVTAGTRTLDNNSFMALLGAQPVAGAALTTLSSPLTEEYVLNSDQQYPLNLQGTTLWQTPGNFSGPEGIVVVNNILQGGGGVVRFAFTIEWVEYNAQGAPGVTL